MAVKQRGGRWQVDVTVAGQRERVSASSQEAAIILEAEVRAAMLAGKEVTVTPGRSTCVTVAALADQVHQRRWKGTKSERTSWINARAAVEFFGRNLPVEEITVDRGDAYVVHLEGLGNSNATVNRKLAALGTMLRDAKDRGYIKEVPKLDRKKESKGRIRFLSELEEDMAVGTFQQWEWVQMADLLIFLVDTGLRRGEALRLEPRDADIEANRVRVWDTKNGESRSVPLTGRAVEMLQRRMGGGPFNQPVNRIFTLTEHQVRHQWDRMKAHIGLAEDTQFVVHALRHTCASRLVQRGVPLAVVKEWLGHKSLTVTMRYSHLAPSNMDEAVKVLEK